MAELVKQLDLPPWATFFLKSSINPGNNTEANQRWWIRSKITDLKGNTVADILSSANRRRTSPSALTNNRRQHRSMHCSQNQMASFWHPEWVELKHHCKRDDWAHTVARLKLPTPTRILINDSSAWGYLWYQRLTTIHPKTLWSDAMDRRILPQKALSLRSLRDKEQIGFCENSQRTPEEVKNSLNWQFPVDQRLIT